MTVFLIISAAIVLFVVAERFGVADVKSAAVGALGSAFIVIVLLVARGAPPAQAPAAPQASLKPQFTYPLEQARSLAQGDGGRGSIDAISVMPANDGSYDPLAKAIVTKAAGTIVLQGWAVDEKRARAGSGALALVDGRPAASAVYGADRNDVASYLGVPDFRFSGYRVEMPAEKLAPGTHELRVAVIAPDARRYEPFGPVLKLTVRR